MAAIPGSDASAPQAPGQKSEGSAIGRMFAGAAQSPPGLQISIAVILFLVLSFWAMRDESATFDEPAHLAAAYVPLVLNDYRLLSEQPPLGRRIAALPLLFQRIDLPLEDPSWRSASYFAFGFRFLYHCGNDADRVLFSARCAMCAWGILLIISVFAVARESFGPEGGLIVLIASVFNPLLIAHAHLVTTDVAVAALIFLAVAAFERWIRLQTLGSAIAPGVIAGGAVATKFSALILGPIFLLMLANLARERPVRSRLAAGMAWKEVLADLPIRRWTLSLVVVGALAYAVVWGAYGFRYRASPDPSFQLTDHLYIGTFSGRTLKWASAWRLFPEAFLCGFAEFRNHKALGHPAYALGFRSEHGWWWYFPFAMLVKTPLSFLALIGVGLWFWMRSIPGVRWAIPVAASILLMLGGMVQSPLNLGLRHAVPLVPFLLVISAAAARTGSARMSGTGTPLLLCVLVLECFAGAPHFLGYFNVAAMASSEPCHLLLDSNLDWGQDLRRLKDYMDRNGIPRVKLAYLGSASPRQLRLNHEKLKADAIYSTLEPEWEPSRHLEPGDYVAVSATYLAGTWLERPVRLELVARIGRSIQLFRVLGP